MPKNPIQPILCCFGLAIFLYGILLNAARSVGGSSSSNVGDILSNIFEPLIFLTAIFPIYVVITLATAWWLHVSFRRTKPKQNGEARVLGFFTILLMVPHIALVMTVGIFWVFG